MRMCTSCMVLVGRMPFVVRCPRKIASFSPAATEVMERVVLLVQPPNSVHAGRLSGREGQIGVWPVGADCSKASAAARLLCQVAWQQVLESGWQLRSCACAAYHAAPSLQDAAWHR